MDLGILEGGLQGLRKGRSVVIFILTNITNLRGQGVYGGGANPP